MKFLLLFFICSLGFADAVSVTISALTTASVTTTSTQIVAARPKRTYLLIQNNGTDSVIVKFKTAQSASEGVVIQAGGNYEPYKGVYDAVFMKSASGTQSVTVVEGE